MAEWTPFIIAIMAFVAIAGTAFVGGHYYLHVNAVNRRLPLPPEEIEDAEAAPGMARFVARHFGEKRFGIDETLSTAILLWREMQPSYRMNIFMKGKLNGVLYGNR